MKLSSLVDRVSEEFVRRVLEQMFRLKREFDEPHVRIALHSSEETPDYEIMSVVDDEWVMIKIGFRGKTHREMPDDARMRTMWSESYMTLAEVAELRQIVRQKKAWRSR